MNDEESTVNNRNDEALTKFYFFLIGITLLIAILTYAIVFFVIIGIFVAIGFLVVKGALYVTEWMEKPPINISLPQNDNHSSPDQVFCQAGQHYHPKSFPHLECQSCGQYQCSSCHADCVRAGKSTCLFCNGRLKLIKAVNKKLQLF